MCSVQKDPLTKKIFVISTIFKVWVYVCDLYSFYPNHSILAELLFTGRIIPPLQDEHGCCYPGRRDEKQNFAYLIVNPVNHQVTLFSHCYGVGSFDSL